MLGDVGSQKYSKTGARTCSILKKFAFDTTKIWLLQKTKSWLYPPLHETGLDTFQIISFLQYNVEYLYLYLEIQIFPYPLSDISNMAQSHYENYNKTFSENGKLSLINLKWSEKKSLTNAPLHCGFQRDFRRSSCSTSNYFLFSFRIPSLGPSINHVAKFLGIFYLHLWNKAYVIKWSFG